jgi:large subunit ribosomal protein L28
LGGSDLPELALYANISPLSHQPSKQSSVTALARERLRFFILKPSKELQNGVAIMAQRCEICGKGPMYGHNVSFSKKRTNRRFMPNLGKRKVLYHGTEQRIKVCANCLRTINKTNKGRFAKSIQ